MSPPVLVPTPAPVPNARPPARWPTGTIVPGASISVNRDHAADQPSGVSGHCSMGCDRVVPVAQIP